MFTVLDKPNKKLDYARLAKQARVPIRIKHYKGNENKAFHTESNADECAEDLFNVSKSKRRWEEKVVKQVHAQSIRTIRIGKEEYDLRRGVKLTIIGDRNRFEARFDSIANADFRGIGNTGHDAEINLYKSIHREFQRLFKTQPMQRIEQDETTWQELRKIIDDESYRQNRSFVFKVTGNVVSIGDDYILFKWFGGDQLSLPVDCLIGEWSNIAVGAWCEAVILQRASGEILQATYLGPVNAPSVMSEDDLKEAYSQIPPAILESAD